ncbi:MAG: hypothetical protein RL514_4186 [Verrucomicrobiota bacterium]|jgi:hypothetical protein
MNDASPGREEASDAPEGRRNGFGGYLMWAALALVLYVLSIGPVTRLVETGTLPFPVLLLYSPFQYLKGDFEGAYIDYVTWWCRW